MRSCATAPSALGPWLLPSCARSKTSSASFGRRRLGQIRAERSGRVPGSQRDHLLEAPARIRPMDDNILLEDQPRRRWRFVPSFSAAGRGRRIVLWVVLAPLLAFVLLYYPVGALWVHKIDDDPDFAPAQVEPNASRTVAMAAALVDREVNQHSWPANHPWFLPGAI